MHRRQFLTGISAAGSIAVAGCSSTESTDTPGGDQNGSNSSDIEGGMVEGTALKLLEADLQRPREDDDIRYNDTFTVDVTIANVGENPVARGGIGSYPQIRVSRTDDERLLTGEGTQTDSETVGMASGQTVDFSMGPFTAAVAGDWTIQAEGDITHVRKDLELDFRVAPRRPSTGEPFQIKPGVSLTVERFELTPSYLWTYRTYDGPTARDVVDLATAPADRCFVVIELTVANNSGSDLRTGAHQDRGILGAEQYSIPHVDLIDEAPNTTLDNVQLRGEPLQDLTVHRQDEATAWLLGTVDVDRRGELAFEFVDWKDVGPVEARVDIPFRSMTLPEFEISHVSLPGEWREGTQSIGFVVENIGDTRATFRGVVEYEGGDSSRTTAAADDRFSNPTAGKGLACTLNPGRSAVLRAPFDLPEGTTYRIQPFGKEVTL